MARSLVFLVGMPQNDSWAMFRARRWSTLIASDRRWRSPLARNARTAGSPPIFVSASSTTGRNSCQWPSASITG
ncbi:MAG: hypothetical protein OXP28_00780 [Gammaproteobacteria bacterium]|nr:hypothetical protein [Gammaproteobacteria bacterium]